MRPFIIGLGRAGCRIAHSLIEEKKASGLLIDTNAPDLSYLRYDYRLLIGKNLLNGEGCELDLELGREALSTERYFIAEKIAELREDEDCFFVFSSFCGGTGGNADIVLEELKKNFTDTVYYIGILPSKEDNIACFFNFHSGYERIAKSCDAFFPVDIDNIRGALRLRGNYGTINTEIKEFFSILFDARFAETKATLSSVSSLSLAKSAGGEKTADSTSRVLSLVQKSLERQTISAEPREAEKAMVIVSGKELDFAGSIPARLWVEKNFGIKEVRGDDALSDRKNGASVLVLLSDIKKCERLSEIYNLSELMKKEKKESKNLGALLASIEKAKEAQEKLAQSLSEAENILKGK